MFLCLQTSDTDGTFYTSSPQKNPADKSNGAPLPDLRLQGKLFSCGQKEGGELLRIYSLSNLLKRLRAIAG